MSVKNCPETAPRRHQGIATNQTPWLPSCTCGWHGAEEMTQSAAAIAAQRHVGLAQIHDSREAAQ